MSDNEDDDVNLGPERGGDINVADISRQNFPVEQEGQSDEREMGFVPINAINDGSPGYIRYPNFEQ